MNRIAIIAALQLSLAATVAGPTAQAQERPGAPPSEALKQCIATSAPGVEQTFPSLNEGVDFLLTKVCAAPMATQAAEQIKAASEAQKARMTAACEDMRKKAPPDNFTDGIRGDPSFWQMCDNPMTGLFDDYSPLSYGYLAATGGESWPEATSLAAQTLLDLRVKRMAQKR